MTDERVRGGCSIHDYEKPELCAHNSTCGLWRTVSCCEVAPETDVVECAKCGKQARERCNFDEEYS
jgi:hypothetical protein